MRIHSLDLRNIASPALNLGLPGGQRPAVGTRVEMGSPGGDVKELARVRIADATALENHAMAAKGCLTRDEPSAR